MAKFSFSFVPVILCAIILGTKYTILLEVLSDILGWLLFPRGVFFVGFTISAMLIGFIYGEMLYSCDNIISAKRLLPRFIISISLVAIFISLGLNTFWLFCIAKNVVRLEFPLKIIRQILLIPFKVITMYYTVKFLENKLNNIINE